MQILECDPFVTSQFLCKVPDVTLVPYFSLASLCSVMLSSDNRNIMDYWIFNARYCFEYVFFLVFLYVIRYNSIGMIVT